MEKSHNVDCVNKNGTSSKPFLFSESAIPFPPDKFGRKPEDKKLIKQFDKKTGLMRQIKSNPHQLAAEVKSLTQGFSEFTERYNVTKKIGEGSFSKVFLATMKEPSWEEIGRLYAVKILTKPTSFFRAHQELVCMMDMGGKDNVVPVVWFILGQNSGVYVMPYFVHQQFSEYFRDLSVEEVKSYFRNLMLALRRVHSFNLIHRDVKPGNFLFNRQRNKYQLVDFGLTYKACIRFPNSESQQSYDSKHHSQNSKNSLRECLRPTLNPNYGEVTALKSYGQPAFKDTATNFNDDSAETENTPPKKAKMSFTSFPATAEKLVFMEPPKPFKMKVISRAATKNCSVCSRYTMYAQHAGTAGFRPPEVLLHSFHQTTAVDMWSAGIVLLCVMSGCYPFFSTRDDASSLAEITRLLGSQRMKQVAEKCGCRIQTNEHERPLCFKKLCYRARARLWEANTPGIVYQRCNVCFQSIEIDGCLCPGGTVPRGSYYMPPFPDSAYDLLECLLDPNPVTRITASDALKHPFLAE